MVRHFGHRMISLGGDDQGLTRLGDHPRRVRPLNCPRWTNSQTGCDAQLVWVASASGVGGSRPGGHPAWCRPSGAVRGHRWRGGRLAGPAEGPTWGPTRRCDAGYVQVNGLVWADTLGGRSDLSPSLGAVTRSQDPVAGQRTSMSDLAVHVCAGQTVCASPVRPM